jgi:molybdopterin-binding protein
MDFSEPVKEYTYQLFLILTFSKYTCPLGGLPIKYLGIIIGMGLHELQTQAKNLRTQEEVGMRISARNILKGKVKKVVPGAVNSEVVIELPGGAEIVSIITKSSATSLGLKKGKAVYAVVKASNVMIAVD